MAEPPALLARLRGFERRPATRRHRPPGQRGTEAAGPPQVVLFGWTGASRGALRKYASVWNGAHHWLLLRLLVLMLLPTRARRSTPSCSCMLALSEKRRVMWGKDG